MSRAASSSRIYPRRGLHESGWVMETRDGFCGHCGARAEAREGGHMRICSAQECARLHFPRTDPVVITVVSDGDRCLLGQSRGRLRRMGMYSALAGFVD